MRIHGHTLIRRPPEIVFDFVADERNNYDPTVDHAELLTGEPVGVGTRFRCISTRRRRPVEMTVEIVEHDRPHRLVTVTRVAGMDITSTLNFRPERGETRLEWSSDLSPRGFVRALTPLLALFGRRQTAAIWANLKHTLEAQTPHRGQRGGAGDRVCGRPNPKAGSAAAQGVAAGFWLLRRQWPAGGQVGRETPRLTEEP